MKIILTANLSIKNELNKIAIQKEIEVEERIALDIQNINLDQNIYESYINNANKIIFQSKNAVKYASILHDYLLGNKKAKMYCLGKFTGNEIQKYYANKVIYPKDNYSSESLMKIIKNEKGLNDKYLIIKGEDGRNYLEDEIRKFSKIIKVISVYKRVPIKNFLDESSINKKTNNYFIVSSKSALIELIANISSCKNIAPLILIIPNERIINEVDTGIFKDIIIICNSNNAETYISTIERHNEQN